MTDPIRTAESHERLSCTDFLKLYYICHKIYSTKCIPIKKVWLSDLSERGLERTQLTTNNNRGAACRKRRLKWVLGAWGYNWATQSPGDINMESWSSKLGVGRGADDPIPEKVNS
jgi:hypothetical protein